MNTSLLELVLNLNSSQITTVSFSISFTSFSSNTLFILILIAASETTRFYLDCLYLLVLKGTK